MREDTSCWNVALYPKSHITDIVKVLPVSEKWPRAGNERRVERFDRTCNSKDTSPAGAQDNSSGPGASRRCGICKKRNFHKMDCPKGNTIAI